MSVTKKAVRGAAWSIPTSIASRAIGLVGTLILARYLVPEEYGEVSAAAIMVQTASTISTFGVGMYVLANPKAPRSEIFHATVWHVALGLIALLAAVLFRDPLGPVFDAPEMGKFVPGLALALLFERVAFIPERTLLRDLRFRVVSLMRTAAELTFTAVSVGTAVAGAGAMSIVYGNLARSIVRTAVTVGAAHRHDWLEWSRLEWATLKKLITYGATVSLAGVASFAARRWDNLMVSRFFGPATMGAYNFAYNLADIPAVQVGEQITDVLLASFPHLEPEKRSKALIRACTLLGLIMFPLAVGLGACGPSIVHFFFNRKWVDVAPMLVLLSVLSVPRPIAGALSAYLHAVNRPRAVFFLEWFSLALLMASIASFGRLGPRWTCVAVGFAFTVRMLANMWVLKISDGIPLRKLLMPLGPPLLACVPMLAMVVWTRHTLRDLGWGPGASLLVEVPVGAAVYVVGALVIARDASQELIRLVKQTLLRRKS